MANSVESMWRLVPYSAAVQVEKDDRLQGDGWFELLDLQAAGRGSGLPVNAPHGITGHVVTLAAHTRWILENRQVMAQCSQWRTGGQFCIGQGNDARVNRDEIGLLFQVEQICQAESVAEFGGEGPNRIIAALVGHQVVYDLRVAVRAQAEDARLIEVPAASSTGRLSYTSSHGMGSQPELRISSRTGTSSPKKARLSNLRSQEIFLEDWRVQNKLMIYIPRKR